MYVIKCMSRIRSCKEIRKDFREKNYDILLETPNVDSYIYDAAQYVNKIIEEKVSAFCEKVDDGFKPFVDDLKTYLLNMEYYQDDFAILEYLSLLDLFCENDIYVSVNGISKSQQVEIQDNKEIASKMIAIWNTFCEKYSGDKYMVSDAIPNFPFDIKVENNALKCKDNSFEKLFEVLMSNDFFNCLKLLKNKR